ncbi:winged helix-turn-helix domain-containing protein [Microvirga aerilata]|uniref:Winged helix-turn-helix domain-containing protein n=1 Tax=Microvirga aerilata TaxID=670292 RepID=A0A936Z9U4_9HYPH|nr:helix-turn-helix domain-containing protein [Microvirga aerilata]MBL0405637.1 winged helix-turn-helix domain-containing protein [Microvirga aerilata]
MATPQIWEAVRLRAVGLVNGYSCDWPITQTEIGDALGVTTVHVNRFCKPAGRWSH